MGMLSDFFIAAGDAVPDYDGVSGVDDEDKCEAKGIGPLQVSTMLAVLRGEEDPVEALDELELLTAEEAESWTMSVPDDFVEAFAKVTAERIAPLSAQLAEATAEELGASQAELEPLVARLAALARRAKATNKKMYFWTSL